MRSCSGVLRRDARTLRYAPGVVEGHPFRDAPVRKLPSAQIKPRGSRVWTFAGLAVVAVIWNVLSGWQLASAIELGPGSAIAFVGLFVFVGMIILGSAVYAFLAIFNPTVEIFVGQEQPALGEPLELGWRLVGKTARVQRLQIDLEGVEEATYTRGTDTVTERERFVTLSVAATADRDEIARGTATVVIPHGLVPSFAATHNKIVWRLVVQGDVSNWPDIDEEFLLDVVAHRRVRVKAAA